jgi:hypothetical protein
MTNTLHRFGSVESFVDDIIVHAIPAKGKSGQGDALPALKRFLEIATEYSPVNLGDALHGGALRATRSRRLITHFLKRDNRKNFRMVIDGLTNPTTVAAVFDKLENAEAFVERLKREDFGISVNISTSIKNAKACCDYAGLKRHSIGYSLGFEGMGDNIPNSQAIMLSTMCGHGMVAHSLAKKMIDFVKENRRTPEEAASSMARFCACGIFNTTRAVRILEDARIGRTE